MNQSNQQQRLLRDISDDVDAAIGDLMDLPVAPINRSTVINIVKLLNHAMGQLQRAQFGDSNVPTSSDALEGWESDL